VQATITGYPRALEPSVIDPDRAIAALADIRRLYGPRAAVWRYDPVLSTTVTPPEWHRRNVARLAAGLRGIVDEVVLSFAQVYRKTKRNCDAAAAHHGFDWQDPEDGEKRALLADLAGIAEAAGLRASLCSQPDLLGDGALFSPLQAARCIDARRLSDVAGQPVAARTKGNRPGCLCAESRDIGAYDTCPHGCVYCYAVRDRQTAKRRHRAHDAAAPSIIPDA
jgi:hypothetical protein